MEGARNIKDTRVVHTGHGRIFNEIFLNEFIRDVRRIFRIDDLNICLQYDCQYGLRTKEEDAE